MEKPLPLVPDLHFEFSLCSSSPRKIASKTRVVPGYRISSFNFDPLTPAPPWQPPQDSWRESYARRLSVLSLGRSERLIEFVGGRSDKKVVFFVVLLPRSRRTWYNFYGGLIFSVCRHRRRGRSRRARPLPRRLRPSRPRRPQRTRRGSGTMRLSTAFSSSTSTSTN